ncbi:MAG: hypothetical protein EPO24_15465 [Bacteroidetes bacterium]|nr:MAG: hypothetical protein EPO24_15465 [Bacteroidota bacterium]
MKFLANENFPVASVRILQEAGYDTKFIGFECPSISDVEVITLAVQESRTIITFDKDYGELIYKYGHKPKGGVIFLRLKEFTPEEPAEYLLHIIRSTEIIFENYLTVIDSKNIRQRKY